MKIVLSPQIRFGTLTLSVSGSVLTVNGTAVDLASYDAETATNDWIVGQPFQIGGIWQVTVILPIGTDASEAARFPDPATVEVGDVTLPV